MYVRKYRIENGNEKGNFYDIDSGVVSEYLSDMSLGRVGSIGPSVKEDNDI